MIESLSLYNFQSHKETNINFDPGVNIIIGPSDSGKSAILRGLYWLKDNRPSGDNFRSHWGGDTKVKIKFTDVKFFISRNKGKGINNYIINKEKLEGFSTEVPEEVSSVINFSDVNIQKQMDSPFLLSVSAGEVAGHLNKAVNLDVIDRALKNINKKKRDTNTDLVSAENQLAEFKEDMTDYDNLEDQEQLVLDGERLESQITILKNTKEEIYDLVDNIKTTEVDIKKYNRLISFEEKLTPLISLEEEIDELEIQHSQLGELKRSILTAKEDLKKETIEHSKMQKRLKEIMPDICPLCGGRVKK